MQNAPPPPSMPLSPTSMDSMLRLDLATLRTDAVLVYASRVAQLQASTSLSNEKLRMLFMLCQKLLQWFVSERRELERLNHTLQEELLEALRPADGKDVPFDHSQRGDGGRSVVPPPIVCGQEASVQTEMAETDRLCDSQATHMSAQMETDAAQERPSSGTQASQTDPEAQLLEAAVLVQDTPSETQATQTDTEVERVEMSIQTEAEAEHVEMSVQTDTETKEERLSDSQATQTEFEHGEMSVQTDAAPECVESGFQTEDVHVEATDTSNQTESPPTLVGIDTQTDAAAALVESCAQTDSCSELIECGVQVVIEPEVVDCGIQAITEPEVVDGCVQTPAVESTSVETQATTVLPTMADQAACTLDLISWADGSTETEPIEPEEKPPVTAVVTPPLETYFQVQRSVMMLQRIVRGFVTRRRFYRMLTELVNAK